jgi:hypothetical protein
MGNAEQWMQMRSLRSPQCIWETEAGRMLPAKQPKLVFGVTRFAFKSPLFHWS